MDKASKGPRGTRRRVPGAGAPTDANEGKRLLGLVESEIIPRLVRAYGSQSPAAPALPAIRPPDVEAFAHALLERSQDNACDLLAAHCARGVPLEAIYLQLFAPAARYLGELWETDLMNFSQVTLCVWRLQSLLHDLSPSFRADSSGAQRESAERRILLGTLPNQQHTFGLSILSEFFRRDGWVVLSIPAPEPGEIQGTLSKHWFDVLALSASMDGEVDDLGKTIKAARRTSQNPRLAVMVGGPLFLREPELAVVVGADAMSVDAPHALAMADQLIWARQEIRMN